MEPLLEECEYLGGLDDIDQLILGRASARLSEILPRCVVNQSTILTF